MESSQIHHPSPYVTIGGQPVGVSAGAGRAAASTPQPDFSPPVVADAFWPRLWRTHRIWLLGGLGALGLALGLVWLLGLRADQRA